MRKRLLIVAAVVASLWLSAAANWPWQWIH